MDSKVLLEILKSMSMAVTDAMSIATAQTLGLQQMRREAAIESAPKGSLTTEAKRKLRLNPLTSKLLFGGQISDIYKENVTENQERLVKKAVNYQAKPNPSESLRLNLVRTSLRLRKLLRRISLLFLLDHHVEEMLLVGLVPEVEALAPLVEEPLALGNTESQPPLPLPLPNIPVRGRLAHFAQNWAEITDDN